MKYFSYIVLLIVALFLYFPKSKAQSLEFLGLSEVHLDPLLSESSGIVYARGKLWTHNDSGGEVEIYVIDSMDGSVTQTIVLDGLVNHDWEDIASDDSFLYIADTGNNKDGGRVDLAIYKIRLDDLPLTGDAVIPNEKIEIIRFYYPEQGVSPEPAGSNNTAFDCEAICVYNDTIHLFTKDWTSIESGYASSEYVLPNIPLPDDGKYAAQFFARHEEMGFLVTGADNWGAEYVILIGYQIEAMGAHFVRLYSNFEKGNISSGINQAVVVGGVLNCGQVEAICFGEEPLKGFITNETFRLNDFYYPASLKSFEFIYSKSDYSD